MLKNRLLPFDEKFEVQINAFIPAQGNHLFNVPAYFKMHSRSYQDCYAQLVRRSDSQVYATLAFHETDADVYVSTGTGTYGGLSLNHPIEFLNVEKFFQVVIEHLRQQGAQTIRIRCAPSSHEQSLFAISFNALVRQEFLPAHAELNYDIRIDGRAFIAGMDYGNVKRIRKAERAGFVCKRVDLGQLPAVHHLIAQNRARLGVPISMSLAQLDQMAAVFPERMHLFAVYRDVSDQDMVAAALCLVIAPGVLYVLYWGEGDGMRNFSPVTMLAATIYAFGALQGYCLLDIGIATLHSKPNYGLINFKRNLGFTESLKLEMVWQGQTTRRRHDGAA